MGISIVAKSSYIGNTFNDLRVTIKSTYTLREFVIKKVYDFLNLRIWDFLIVRHLGIWALKFFVVEIVLRILVVSVLDLKV